MADVVDGSVAVEVSKPAEVVDLDVAKAADIEDQEAITKGLKRKLEEPEAKQNGEAEGKNGHSEKAENGTKNGKEIDEKEDLVKDSPTKKAKTDEEVPKTEEKTEEITTAAVAAEVVSEEKPTEETKEEITEKKDDAVADAAATGDVEMKEAETKSEAVAEAKTTEDGESVVAPATEEEKVVEASDKVDGAEATTTEPEKEAE